MKQAVISRNQLLSAAKEIAYSQGLSQVNIRAVAAKCGVSVGSLYNYFATKADLVAAIVEDFWHQTAHRNLGAPLPGESFADYFGRMYGELRRGMEHFRTDWLAQLAALDSEAKAKGRALEAQYFSHMRRALAEALDVCGAPTCGPAGDRAAFADFVFQNLLSLLREGAPDCAFFQQVLRALTEERT